MPKVSDLFVLQYGHSLELNRLTISNSRDAVNFVGRAARNNGVTARVRRIEGLKPAAAGTISVALGGQGGAGTAFLQPHPYYCGRDVMILTAKLVMTEEEKLWWAFCITANRFRFGFGRQANRSLKSLPLPPRAGMPTWVTGLPAVEYVGADAPANDALVALSNTSAWRPYTLGKLFDIRKGQRLTKIAMLPGKTPYVGASDRANGITALIGQAPKHDGGTITVTYNGSVAEAFYQPLAFWASDDVNVLYPRGFELNVLRALFLCTVIRQEKYRFSYGRKWHLERMRDSAIRLPSNDRGEPDWDHIESFVKSLPFSSRI